MAKVKKVDEKKVAKTLVSTTIAEALRAQGFTVDTESADFGFSDGTLVISLPNTDVQVKFIAPKAGTVRYEKVVEESAETTTTTTTETNADEKIEDAAADAGAAADAENTVTDPVTDDSDELTIDQINELIM